MLSMRWLLLCIVLMSCGFDLAVLKYIQPPGELKSEQSKSFEKICLTKTCNDTASEILRNMDVTVDPCDDFYQFACGGWIKSTNITDEDEEISIVSQEYKIFMNQLEMSLNETIKEDEPRPLKMVKAYFKSCMDESGIEKNSVESLLQIIKSVGGWPLIEGDKWNETNFDWIECISELQKMGYFIDNMPQVYVDRNMLNETQRAVFLMQWFSVESFVPNANNENIDILQEDLVNITVALGANRTFAKKEVQELFDFFLELYDNVKNNKTTYVEYCYSPETNLFVEFPMKKFIEKLILPFSKIEDDTTFCSSNTIDDLTIFMEKTPKRIQANYIIWNAISKSVDSLNKDIREKYKKLLIDGGLENTITKYSSRTEECMEVTKQSMPVSLSALYIRNHFDRDLKNDTIKISENIRRQIDENLKGAIWISPSTKNLFRRKIEKMATFVAYESDFFNDTELENVDKDLNISSSNDYLNNNINLMKYMMGKTFAKLQKPTGKFDTLEYLWNYIDVKEEWKNFDLLAFYLSRFEWNAWYLHESNAAVIPAVILQGIMNKIDNPEYIKYGATGLPMGHEFYHGIDNFNRDVDENFQQGNLDDYSQNLFGLLDTCFVDQYSNYSLGGINLDGRKFLPENIADYGGIKATYMAYSDWASKQDEPELLLPNLPYTQKQLFWISTVNNFCSKRRDPNSYNVYDVHTPDPVRIPGAFSNMPDFARDFNCPVGSKMNRKYPCFV